MKLTVLAAANNYHFIDPIITGLRGDGWSVETHPKSMDDFRATDAVWLEWADGVCINALTNKKPHGAKYILRLHRYELFTPRTLGALNGLTKSGHHKKIDRLVFVSEYVRQIGIEKFPWMAENSVVIPNLIDISMFPFWEHRWRDGAGFNLLFLGRQSYVKNLPHMLHLFNDLYRMDDRYRLHIVGKITDPEIEHYLRNFEKKADAGGAVAAHGRIEQPRLFEFMRRTHYIVCTSIFESQGVGILEAMATGMRPVVYSFPGARGFFPDRYLFLTADEFLRHFIDGGKPKPHEYRSFVEESYSIQKQIHRYANLINEVVG